MYYDQTSVHFERTSSKYKFLLYPVVLENLGKGFHIQVSKGLRKGTLGSDTFFLPCPGFILGESDRK